MEIANTVGIRPAQLAIKWSVQRGTSVIPRSWDERRIRENFEGISVLWFMFLDAVVVLGLVADDVLCYSC
jgi:hypothetical protein